MANQIDQLPYYDPLVKANGVYMADVWIAALSSLIDTLNGYMSPYGFLVPVVTVAQMATIQSPQEGQMIYNIDYTVGPPRTANLLIWQVKAGTGAWRVVTTV